MDDLRETGAALASLQLMGAAILGALGQAGTMHPSAVPAMVERILAEAPAVRQLPPDLRSLVESDLTEFAVLIRAMTTVPAGAGRA